MAIIDWYIQSLKKQLKEFGRVSIFFNNRRVREKDLKKIRRYYMQAGKRIGIRIHSKTCDDLVVISSRSLKGYRKQVDYIDGWAVHGLTRDGVDY